MFYFYLYLTLGLVIINYPPILEYTKIDDYFTDTITTISQYFIEQIGISVTRNGEFLHLSNSILQIEYACSGLDIIILFIATILSLNIKFYNKILLSIITIFIFEFLNIIRIVYLGWILENKPQWFDFIHDYILNILLLSIIFLFLSLILKNKEVNIKQ